MSPNSFPVVSGNYKTNTPPKSKKIKTLNWNLKLTNKPLK